MALSNWDTFALSTGPLADEITSPRGVRVEHYKNWLYVHQPQWWSEGGPYVHDTVAEIHEGDLVLDDIIVKAIRGPQEGIYSVVRTGARWTRQAPLAMVGCGVYGYEGDNWVGVTPGSVKFLYDFAVKELSDWAHCSVLLAPARWATTHRKNQGDDFFAKHLDMKNPGTLPGVADAPFLTQLLARNP